jgi:hypothetical protein
MNDHVNLSWAPIMVLLNRCHPFLNDRATVLVCAWLRSIGLATNAASSRLNSGASSQKVCVRHPRKKMTEHLEYAPLIGEKI